MKQPFADVRWKERGYDGTRLVGNVQNLRVTALYKVIVKEKGSNHEEEGTCDCNRESNGNVGSVAIFKVRARIEVVRIQTVSCSGLSFIVQETMEWENDLSFIIFAVMEISTTHKVSCVPIEDIRVG